LPDTALSRPVDHLDEKEARSCSGRWQSASTRTKTYVAVALDALGVRLDSREIAATAAGYRSLLCWAQEFGVPAFTIEGTGSYGAGLVRFLERAGVDVCECERPRRQERRRGKSDLIDAALAARRLLSGEQALNIGKLAVIYDIPRR
jgi:transposase